MPCSSESESSRRKCQPLLRPVLLGRGDFFWFQSGGAAAARSRSSTSAANSRQRACANSFGRQLGGSSGSWTIGQSHGLCGINFASRLCKSHHRSPEHLRISTNRSSASGGTGVPLRVRAIGVRLVTMMRTSPASPTVRWSTYRLHRHIGNAEPDQCPAKKTPKRSFLPDQRMTLGAAPGHDHFAILSNTGGQPREPIGGLAGLHQKLNTPASAMRNSVWIEFQSCRPDAPRSRGGGVGTAIGGPTIARGGFVVFSAMKFDLGGVFPYTRKPLKIRPPGMLAKGLPNRRTKDCEPAAPDNSRRTTHHDSGHEVPALGELHLPTAYSPAYGASGPEGTRDKGARPGPW